MTHTLYVLAAYAVSAIALLGLTGWILRDQTLQRKGLAELDAQGVRRRSDGERPS